MSGELLRVEHFLDAHRKDYGITQLYSYYSEQGGAMTRLTVDTKAVPNLKQFIEKLRKELPKSARAELNVGNNDGNNGGPGKKVQVQLVGDSTATLESLGADIVPILAKRPELRDVHVDTGDKNSELAVRVDRE